MSKHTFTLSEIETKGLDCFMRACASGQFDVAVNLAKLIIENTTDESIITNVKKNFILLLIEKYKVILSGSEGLVNIGSELVDLYTSGIRKKTDISADVPVFSELARKHMSYERTSHHYDRLYTIFQAVRNAAKVPGDIVELGVFKGGSLKFIGEVADIFGLNKNIVGFDTFEGHVDLSEFDSSLHQKGMFATSGVFDVEVFISNPRVKLVAGNASDTFIKYAESSSCISLAHMDMDLYKPTADTLPVIVDLMSPGGVAVVDDYGFTTCPGVKRAVDDYLDKNELIHYHLMTGQMIIIKK